MNWKQCGFSDHVVKTLEGIRGLNPTDVASKKWGVAVAVSANKIGQMSLAIIDVGGFSSRHYHNQKTNVFSIISGRLIIHEWDRMLGGDVRPADHTITLNEGDSYIVKPDRLHQMEADSDVVCMETYFVGKPGGKVCLNDIFRVTQGGKHEF